MTKSRMNTKAKSKATKKPYYPSMLVVGNNPKTSKGVDITKVLTGIMYFAPSNYSDIANVCAYATDGCREACLGMFAGRVLVFDIIKEARIRRVELFKYDRPLFDALLVKDTKALKRKAKRESLGAAGRLNGASDTPWERVRITVDGVEYPNIMSAFPTVQWYDYTKYPYDKRPAETLPPNYDLTYSHAEGRLPETMHNLANGRRVAVVMRNAPTRWQRLKWQTYALLKLRRWIQIVNGDKHDYRPSDPPGSVVLLKAKGKAKHDKSGFVLDTLDQLK